jgi:Domain of unknown function (DUF4202)
MMAETRLEEALRRIDDANAADPNRETHDGKEVPAAWIYGRRMYDRVRVLNPEASDALLLAARAQHIRRWEFPRTDYPEGKAGYHQWRTMLYGYHGDKVGEILEAVGYDAETIDRVKAILSKKHLRKDADTQTLEDAAALVFLQHHLADFAQREDMDEPKLIRILQKTWAKMSDAGHEHALALDQPEGLAALVAKALE